MHDKSISKTLYDLSQAIRRSTLVPIGKYNELSILHLLHRQGALRITEIAKQEGVTQPGATTIVRRLLVENLVTQRIDAGDARAKLIELLPAGKDVLHQFENQRINQLEEILKQLSLESRQVLEKVSPVLGQISTNLRQVQYADRKGNEQSI
ncbi:MAG: MarR family transcriptional regulator [Micrococcaceae bacterium]